MPATALLTIADLERIPDDGVHRELLEGELIELPPPEWDHCNLAHFFYEALREFSTAGRVYIESGYQLNDAARTWLQPDVSFVSNARIARSKGRKYLLGAPDLAIEIISPSERAADIEAKVLAYRQADATAIWVVYPRTRTIRVIRPDGSGTTLTERDILADAELFPGWQLPLRDVFATGNDCQS